MRTAMELLIGFKLIFNQPLERIIWRDFAVYQFIPIMYL